MTGRKIRRRSLVIGAAIALAMAACSGGADEGDLDDQLRVVIDAQSLTGDPSIGRDLPDIGDPLAQLGMKLFYTKGLGGQQDSACVTCHHPTLGGGDGLPMSIGVGADIPDLLGPGRTHPGGPFVPRNAPTTFNSGMWDEVMFHDGRVESLGKTPLMNGNDGYGIRTPDRPLGYPDVNAGPNLPAAQSMFPVVSEEEMRGFDFGTEIGNTGEARNGRVRDLLAQIIGGYGEGVGVLNPNDWPAEFGTVFESDAPADELITYSGISLALGEYERSQVFVDTPWKAYVEGADGAISEDAKQGALLFLGEAACSTCHTGDFFTDEQFHVNAIPQIGVGRDSGTFGDDDWGRYLETGVDEDRYAFRTPTLTNVEVTGPYGHDGAYLTLEGIIRHHLNPKKAIEEYDFGAVDSSIRVGNAEAYTQAALEQLEENRSNGVFTVRDIDLSDEQVDQLVAFLLTLTDPCVKSRQCLAPWIPDESVADPDGLRLDAVNAVGEDL
ncbi:MAG: cytochrome c peroxidase [Actinomycetota bacterium]|nr:cytochrome c peroxidase [Actinomycetota bacterium]